MLLPVSALCLARPYLRRLASVPYRTTAVVWRYGSKGMPARRQTVLYRVVGLYIDIVPGARLGVA